MINDEAIVIGKLDMLMIIQVQQYSIILNNRSFFLKVIKIIFIILGDILSRMKSSWNTLYINLYFICSLHVSIPIRPELTVIAPSYSVHRETVYCLIIIIQYTYIFFGQYYLHICIPTSYIVIFRAI